MRRFFRAREARRQRDEGRTQGPSGPSTTRELVRSWSLRTIENCLSEKKDSLPTGGGGGGSTRPESAQDKYFQGLSELFHESIACDMNVRILSELTGTCELQMHRSILAATRPEFFETCSTRPGEDGTDKNEYIVRDGAFLDPQDFLTGCYGVSSSPAPGTKNHPNISPRLYVLDRTLILHKLSELHPDKQSESLKRLAPPDVCIVGSANAASPNHATADWTLKAHAAILCAQSTYFRSILGNSNWSSSETEDVGDGDNSTSMRIIRLDSNSVNEASIRKLLLACYGLSLKLEDVSVDHVGEKQQESASLETVLAIIGDAAYFGMDAVSAFCEDYVAKNLLTPGNLSDVVQFAQDTGAKLLLIECCKYLCWNLRAIQQEAESGDAAILRVLEGSGAFHDHEPITSPDGGGLGKISSLAMEAMVRCDFLDTDEDLVLEAVLTWSTETNASFDKTKELVELVRLPLVPVVSSAMLKAVEQNLVAEDMLRVCRLFQTDGDYRATMMNCEVRYRPRHGEQMEMILLQNRNRLERDRQERDLFLRDRYFSNHLALCRMLGSVNGRDNFEKIQSVRLGESGDYLLFSPSADSTSAVSSTSFSFSFDFNALDTPSKPTSSKESSECVVDQAAIEAMSVGAAEKLLAKMLRRENELRLHSKVQAAYGLIGEDEAEMSTFTTALQGHVASEFNVDPSAGIKLIRSASTLFPETSQLAHYVRHNRCFKGSMAVGDEAPDVKLSTISSQATTLWTEIDAVRGTGDGERNKPVVILGASFT